MVPVYFLAIATFRSVAYCQKFLQSSWYNSNKRIFKKQQIFAYS